MDFFQKTSKFETTVAPYYILFSLIQVKVHGTVAKGLEPVQELFQEQFNKGEELSAQVVRHFHKWQEYDFF